jgi:hypothetical protein
MKMQKDRSEFRKDEMIMMKRMSCWMILCVMAAWSAAAPFKMAVLPDTQYYSKSYPEIFNSQTQWIADHAQAEAIRFVTHLGDIVNNYGEDPNQWLNAHAAISILDGDPTLYPNKRVPYSVSMGNHDMHTAKDKYGGYAEYLYFFGSPRYAGCSWYGGSNRSGASHYQVFEAGGRQWLHLNMEVFPDDEALKWAQDVLDAHADLPAIYSTHAYLSDKEDPNTLIPPFSTVAYNTVTSNGGLGQWTKLIYNNDQIFLVLNGHHSSEDTEGNGEADGESLLISQNAWGRDVIQMCCDYQNYDNGGNGWMRLLELDDAGNQLRVRTYSPYLNAEKTDSTSRFSVPLNFAERLSQFRRREVIPTVQAANIEVVELSAGNEPNEIIVSIPAGQRTAMMSVQDPNAAFGQSNRGDYVVKIGNVLEDDLLNGVHIASIAENGRQNGLQLNFHTPAMGYGQTHAWIAVFTTSLGYAGYAGGDEDNVNVGVAYFPFSGGWIGGRALNMNNNSDIWVVHGSGPVVLNETLVSAAGMSRPYPFSGSLFAATAKGAWKLTIPGVDSLRDGVLIVCGGKNEDNYASASPQFDGSGWMIATHDNGVNGASWEQDPFNYVYIPYETPGIAAGVIWGSGGVLNGTRNFRVKYESAGTYRLSVDGHSPKTGTLLVCSGPGSYSDDNIITYQPDGNDWLIQTRDLPIDNGTTYSVQTNLYEAFTFAFIPFAEAPSAPGPNRTAEITGMAAGDFTVVNNTATVLGGIYTRNSRNYLSSFHYDSGDYGMACNGYQLPIDKGVLIATARQSSRTYSGSTYVPTISTDRAMKEGGQGVVVHKAASTVTEGESDFAAAWFTYSDGFSGGHVDTTLAVAASGGKTPTVRSGGLAGSYRVSLAGTSARDGVLFVTAQNAAKNTTASAAPSADGSGWDVVTRTNQGAFGYTAERFGYLYLPYNSEKVMIGHVGGNGMVKKTNGNATVIRQDKGVYRVRIPGGSPEQGVLMLNGYGQTAGAPGHFAMSYTGDNGEFVVTCMELSATQAVNDTDFVFAYVPFDTNWTFTYIQPSTDMSDFAAFARTWQRNAQSAGFNSRWDYDHNSVVDLTDLMVFVERWLQ